MNGTRMSRKATRASGRQLVREAVFSVGSDRGRARSRCRAAVRHRCRMLRANPPRLSGRLVADLEWRGFISCGHPSRLSQRHSRDLGQSGQSGSATDAPSLRAAAKSLRHSALGMGRDTQIWRVGEHLFCHTPRRQSSSLERLIGDYETFCPARRDGVHRVRSAVRSL